MAILNFGSLNIDRVYKVPHFVKPGETISSDSYKCFPGGKGLNQSIAVARAGERVFHAGKIGKDGLFLKEMLKENGVDVRYVQENGSVTGHALIQVSETGENCIILYGGSNFENDVESIDRVLDQFGEGDILVLQNEISNLEYLLAKGKSRKMRILLNPSPVDAALETLDLSAVTWLVLNETEGEVLAGDGRPDEILNILHEKYPHMKIVLTLGKQGAVYFDGTEKIKQECFQVNTVDTTAAGDTFTGYLIGGIEQGKSVREALRTAACAAALAVSKEGAAVSIPHMGEVKKRISKGEKNPDSK